MYETSKYSLGLCVPFHPYIHGFTSDSYKHICEHYILDEEIDTEEFITSYRDIVRYLILIKTRYRNILREITNTTYSNHNVIRNYIKLMNNIFKFNTEIFIEPSNIPRIDIIKYEYLETGECVAYLKTFWLKIFQRKWKNIYKKRQEIIKQRGHPYSLRFREIEGKWKYGLRNY